MSNSIAYASKYLNMLDRIYKAGSVTAILEAADSKYKFSSENEKTILLRKLSLQGLGDYSRASGYDSGDATVTWESHQFAIDRSKKFNLDSMDAKEALMAIAELAAEFERVHVVPEVDAYRFKKICTLCGIDATADLTVDTVIAAIDAAIEVLDDAEVAKESRVMFVSNPVYTLMKNSGDSINTRMISQSNPSAINRNITTFDDMPIIKVPAARFYQSFDLAASGAGGFSPTAGAKKLNFMITNTSDIIAVTKHVSPKIINPQDNQTFDGWLYGYRLYHDLFIPENKLDSTYIHRKSS